MFPDYVVKKKDLVQYVTTAFLPRKVLIPLKQESGVLCAPLVKRGDKVQEGQVIAEDASGSDSAKIHSSIPGLVLGLKNCAEPDGRNGCAVEIQLNGQFTHIGKSLKTFDWLSWGASSITNRISALGIVNTFSMRNGRSLSADIKESIDNQGKKVFVRLFDEDPSCQTDFVLTNSQFEKIQKGIEILKKILSPEEIVFAVPKDTSLQGKITAFKSESEDSDTKITLIPFDTRLYPIGTKENIAFRYKKLTKSTVNEREIAKKELFVDATTMAVLSEALIYNIPVERVYVHISGDCLKSSAVLKACVGARFGSLAEQLGLETKKIGKIIVNGHLNGFSVPSLDTPITKWVKSVSFISKTDVADYSSGFCMGCGKCSAACPAKIYPNVLYGYLIKSIKVPQDFIRASLLCIECGVCNSACPTKLPLAEIVKILKDRQNA
ncbi:MAG: 4Fe-4S dicluster domain-containing protein [Treponema sp.]|nr:4Fe-4S dicluster domain-containing protein [Treponema sp.]MEE3434656.1 4Fe-4S dicluster domain-containing protein [Treponema sp.]